ncbi:MAG: sortase [Patescibacteria group bacterium]
MSQVKITFANNSDQLSLMTKRRFSNWKNWLKTAVTLLAIFFSGFTLINTDFESLKYTLSSYWRADSVRKVEFSKEWLQKYSIVLNDKMSINDDSDGDGLSLIKEARYGTNPFAADTDGDGTKDGAEIKAGTNPLGKGELDNDQDGMPDKWELENGLQVNIPDANKDPDNDGLKNIDEYKYGTDPKNPDTDGDGYGDLQEIKNGYDPDAPGDAKPKVIILSDKLSLAVPMVWSQSDDEASLQKDLESGVVHYPKSGVPGQTGNAIISGHSSNYAWAKGSYNSVFKNLNKLETGDAVVVRMTQQNGKVFDYKYKIDEKRITSPDDDWVFENFETDNVLTLSTCWPIGTDISRIIIRAKG